MAHRCRCQALANKIPLTRASHPKRLAAILVALGCVFPALILGGCSEYDQARRIYVQGRYDDAFGRMLKMAQAGDNRAQYDVAMMYVQGIGTTKELELGFGWMIEAAKSGNIGAMNELGAIYESGVGAQRNLPVAFQWYRLAARADDSIGQFNVANMYARGIGVPADIVKAWAYYRRAASNGVLTGRERAALLGEKMSAAQLAEAEALEDRLRKDPAQD